jgi:hypothetical protein
MTGRRLCGLPTGPNLLIPIGRASVVVLVPAVKPRFARAKRKKRRRALASVRLSDDKKRTLQSRIALTSYGDTDTDDELDEDQDQTQPAEETE